MVKKQSFFARLFGKSKKTIKSNVEQVNKEQIEEVHENSDEVTEAEESNESNVDYQNADEAYVMPPAKVNPISIQVDPVDPYVLKTTQDRTYSEITASIHETIEDFENSRNSDVPEETAPMVEGIASDEDEQADDSYAEQQEEESTDDIKPEETEEAEEPIVEEVEEPVVEEVQEDVVEEVQETVEAEEVTVEPEFTTLDDIKELSERYNGIIIDGLTVYNEYGEKRTSIKPLKTELIKDAAVLNGLHVYFGSTSAFSQVMQISDMMKIVSVHVKPTEVAGSLIFDYELKAPNDGAGDVLKAMTNVLIADCPCLSCVTESSVKVDGTKISVSVSFDTTKMADALGMRLFSMSKVIRMIEERVK